MSWWDDHGKLRHKLISSHRYLYKWDDFVNRYHKICQRSSNEFELLKKWVDIVKLCYLCLLYDHISLCCCKEYWSLWASFSVPSRYKHFDRVHEVDSQQSIVDIYTQQNNIQRHPTRWCKSIKSRIKLRRRKDVWFVQLSMALVKKP